MYLIRQIQNYSIFSILFFSGIYQHIQSYSALMRHIHAYWVETLLRHIQVYSGIFQNMYIYSGLFRICGGYTAPCVTSAYSQPCHIQNPRIFRTGGLFKTLWNMDQTYLKSCHRVLFSHIKTYSALCKPRNLANSESWNIQNLSLIGSRHIYWTLSY